MKIIVTKRSADHHACLEGEPGIWAAGRNSDEAVGDLIRSHREKFGLTFHFNPIGVHPDGKAYETREEQK